jgi:hypothetical protein
MSIRPQSAGVRNRLEDRLQPQPAKHLVFPRSLAPFRRGFFMPTSSADHRASFGESPIPDAHGGINSHLLCSLADGSLACAIGVMSDAEFPDAEYWRSRAEEVRTKAEVMHDPIARKMMFGIAESYDRLAQRAERQARR